MKSIHRIGVLVIGAFASAAFAADVKLESDTDKEIYAIGLSLSRSLGTFNLSEAEVKVLEAGIADGIAGKTDKVDLKVYGPKIQELAKARAEQVAALEKKASEEFLKKAAAEKGAVKTDSGLIYSETTAGTGAMPKPESNVKVNYKGTLRDGTVFDSSYDRKAPVTFTLKQVIPCWTEGLQKMKVGGKAKLVCPSAIAYGDRGMPPVIKPGSTLAFEVELLEIVEKPAAAAPAPAAPAPAAK